MTPKGDQIGVRLSPAILRDIDGEVNKGNARSRSECVRDWIKAYHAEHYVPNVATAEQQNRIASEMKVAEV